MLFLAKSVIFLSEMSLLNASRLPKFIKYDRAKTLQKVQEAPPTRNVRRLPWASYTQ